MRRINSERANFALTDIVSSEAGHQSVKTARRADMMTRRAKQASSCRAGYMLCKADSVRRKWRSRAAASLGVRCAAGRRGRANAVRDDKIATMKF